MALKHEVLLAAYLRKNKWTTREKAQDMLQCSAASLYHILVNLRKDGYPIRWETGTLVKCGEGLIWWKSEDPEPHGGDLEDRLLDILKDRNRITVSYAAKILKVSPLSVKAVCTKLQREMPQISVRKTNGVDTIWVMETLPRERKSAEKLKAMCKREFCEFIDKEAGYCPFRYCIYPGSNYILLNRTEGKG